MPAFEFWDLPWWGWAYLGLLVALLLLALGVLAWERAPLWESALEVASATGSMLMVLAYFEVVAVEPMWLLFTACLAEEVWSAWFEWSRTPNRSLKQFLAIAAVVLPVAAPAYVMGYLAR